MNWGMHWGHSLVLAWEASAGARAGAQLCHGSHGGMGTGTGMLAVRGWL